jgi:hypothetical protein
MSNKSLVDQVKQWSDKIGRKTAVERLVQGGISPVTATRICGGRYKSTPKELVARVLRAELSKDGLLKATKKRAS